MPTPFWILFGRTKSITPPEPWTARIANHLIFKEVIPCLPTKTSASKKLSSTASCRIDDEIVNIDPEYNKLGERPDELLRLVAAKLTPEDNQLLKEYDDIWFAQICSRDELIYSAALMDGLLLGH